LLPQELSTCSDSLYHPWIHLHPPSHTHIQQNVPAPAFAFVSQTIVTRVLHLDAEERKPLRCNDLSDVTGQAKSYPCVDSNICRGDLCAVSHTTEELCALSLQEILREKSLRDRNTRLRTFEDTDGLAWTPPRSTSSLRIKSCSLVHYRVAPKSMAADPRAFGRSLG
jgi:hypothetical protein